MSDMKPFWMVYRDGSNYISKKHETKDDALSEAQRIAVKEAGYRVYVFQAVAACETEKPKVIVTELFGETEHV